MTYRYSLEIILPRLAADAESPRSWQLARLPGAPSRTVRCLDLRVHSCDRPAGDQSCRRALRLMAAVIAAPIRNIEPHIAQVAAVIIAGRLSSKSVKSAISQYSAPKMLHNVGAADRYCLRWTTVGGSTGGGGVYCFTLVGRTPCRRASEVAAASLSASTINGSTSRPVVASTP